MTLQTIWIRYLEHVFGATTLAVATVLTCFMGGLALGSWLFGKYADRIRSPVMAYGIVEGVEGLCAFVIPPIIYGLFPSVNAWMVQHLGNNFMLFSLGRFLIVAVLLIVPTTCMGATLPLVARHFIRHERHMKNVGEKIGALYSINIVGAVLGCFLATFVLLKTIGLFATNVTAGTLSIGVFCLIFFFRSRLERPDADDETDPETDAALEEFQELMNTQAVTPLRSGKGARWMVMLAFFLSGLASMNLQVVWNRAMAMIIGASVYSFALVLLAFLIGLGAGSAVFSRISRRVRNPVMLLAGVEFAVAALAMLSYLYIDELPRVFSRLVMSNISDYAGHVGLVQFIMFIVAALAVLPVTFWMGATFPLTIKVVSTTFDTVGKDVGGVYAINTLGAICGSFLSAFVFVPLFSRYTGGAGMQATYFLSVGLYVFIAAGLMLVAPKPAWAGRAVGAVAVCVACVLCLFYVPRWDLAKLTVGVFRLSLMKDATDDEAWGAPDIRYYYDGVTTTVSIEMWGRHIALKNNGKVDASNGDDMPTQIMVGAYPLVFHPKGPEGLDVAIVGFGSGVTVGSALQFPVRHVDCVELESAVVDASRVFGIEEGAPADPEFNVNHLVYRATESSDYHWSNPDTFIINDRLRLFANDGRNFLAGAQQKYDVIISEPSNPWITGVANMFTKDSFESSARALKDDGVFAQWVQLYELSPENIKTIFRTFASVYPYVVLFSAEDLSSDTVLLGSFSPLTFDYGRVQALFRNERMRQEMNRAYVFSATDVFSRVLLADKEELLDYTNGPDVDTWDDLPINTDDNAHIEFSAPRDLIAYHRFSGYLATIYTSSWQYGQLDGRLTGVPAGADGATVMSRMAVSLLMNGRKLRAERFAQKAVSLDPDNAAAQRSLKMVDLLLGKQQVSVVAPDTPRMSVGATNEDARRLEREVNAIAASLKKRAHALALGQALNVSDALWKKGGAPMLHLKGYLHFLNADPLDSTECKDAIEVLTQLLREHDDYVAHHPEIYYFLGLCHDNDLNFDKAVKYVRRFVDTQAHAEAMLDIRQRQARANLEAALSGQSGTAFIELPGDSPAAPTTDAPRESPKEFR